MIKEKEAGDLQKEMCIRGQNNKCEKNLFF